MSCEIIQFSTAARVSAKRHVSDEAIVDAVDRVLAQRHEAAAISVTAQNGRLREPRMKAWEAAEAATRYWRTWLDFHRAIEAGPPEGDLGRSCPSARQ
jgi:hypothetical protein